MLASSECDILALCSWQPYVVIGLCGKACIPMTIAAIIECEQQPPQKGQGGQYNNDEHIGRAITYGRSLELFCNSCHRPCKRMGCVGFTDELGLSHCSSSEQVGLSRNCYGIQCLRLISHELCQQTFVGSHIMPRLPDCT